MAHEYSLQPWGVAMLKMVGSSGQISLGKKYAGKYFEVDEREDGSIFMVPMRVIPESEAWLHSLDLQAQLRRADDWYREHPPAETNLDALAQKLGVDA
ncbi:MAG: hypothetical protein DM484_12225 [Candidatus Methylumidiphilus alinenensis]|uniref:Uncharacterized protein n=1 Tax=Candidatus Methylumidiphilus alinenensis TaxID=2202197 RepID=A0A2W4SUG0_9GAMM|nr:MAG: hypothetical protein DM484_12225 [Candidatus Methylumidiphilus alinenensis]